MSHLDPASNVKLLVVYDNIQIQKKIMQSSVVTLYLEFLVLLMEEILHQFIGSISHYLQGFYKSQVVGNGISEPSTVLPQF